MIDEEFEFMIHQMTGTIRTLSAMERDRADRLPDNPAMWLLSMASVAMVLRDWALQLYVDAATDQFAELVPGPEILAEIRKIVHPAEACTRVCGQRGDVG